MANLTPPNVMTLPVALVPAQPADQGSRVLGLLHAGIPLTLLFDLARPAGPDSASIYEDEAGDATDWLISRSA